MAFGRNEVSEVNSEKEFMRFKTKDLLALPLFLGMNRDELETVGEIINISETLQKKGKTIVEAGKECKALHIIVEGRVAYETWSDDRSYSVQEKLDAPLLIQPERIFGLTQRFTSTVTALSVCKMIVIDKMMVVKLMDMSNTFRINFVNIVTTQSQRLQRQLWHQWPQTIEQRVVRFIKEHCAYPAGEKRINIQMNTLARELGCSRLEVSQALHQLEEKELIIMRRAIVDIPMMQRL